ncbi:S46 family peptidase [Stakelama sediminis]
MAMLAVPAHADEGMWTFDAFPAAKMQAKYGWAPDAAWLKHVQNSAVRLTGGCSASFVSGEGLILTNHHCVRECAQDLSDASHDYIANGFVADDRTAERKCPGQQAEVVTSITDVTPVVQAAEKGLSGSALVKAIDAATAKIEKDNCPDTVTTRCQVVTLFGGAQYKLYKYHKYSDVRLVWAPSGQAAAFGGDPDNFNYPRYGLDAAFLRAYVDGKPAVTPQHLKWDARGPQDGEITMVAGNPGSTDRLYTKAQRIFARDDLYPFYLTLLSEYRGRLISKMEDDPQRERTGTDALFGTENSFKALSGYVGSLRDPKFAAKLNKAQEQLRAKVAADPTLAKKVGDPWSQIADAENSARDLYQQYMLLEPLAGFQSTLYGYARTIVRAAEERQKPDADRLPGYNDAALPLMEKRLMDSKPVYPWLEKMDIEFWLTKVREYMTADSPVTKAMLGKQSPEQIADALVNGTKLADPAYRKKLFEGGLAAVKASDDPMIRYVLAHDQAARDIRQDYIAKVVGPIAAAEPKLADARFGVYGDTLYPDATFTLRLSYGTVKGWDEKGKPVPFETYYGGMFDRATGNPPFNLPKAFIAHKADIDMKTPLDFVTTNDIIGGNSGSPVIAKDGSVIGAAFDGNIHMLGGNFGYDPVLNRTVVVSTAAVQEALEHIYPAPRLLKELNGK